MLAGQHFPLSQLIPVSEARLGQGSPCSAPGLEEDPAGPEPRYPISVPKSHKGRSFPSLPSLLSLEEPQVPLLLARGLPR